MRNNGWRLALSLMECNESPTVPQRSDPFRVKFSMVPTEERLQPANAELNLYLVTDSRKINLD